VIYQWGKPQLDEVENAQGQVYPTDKLLKRPARRPKAEEKASCPCLLNYYGKNVMYVCALAALHLPAAGRSSANSTLAGFG